MADKPKPPVRRQFFSGGTPRAGIALPGRPTDRTTGSGDRENTIIIGSNTYKIYPFGGNNLLIDDMVDLARSNADVVNLLETRVDFLVGAGIGLFQEVIANGKAELQPLDLASYPKATAWLAKNDLPAYAEGVAVGLVYGGNAYVSIEGDARDGLPVLDTVGSTLVRAELAQRGVIRNYVICPDWRRKKDFTAVAAWDPATERAKALLHLRREQAGQFYYGYATYWSIAEWIKLANRIAQFHNNGLDTAYNAAYICRVAGEYFEKFGGDSNEEKEKFRDQFYDNVDKMMAGEQGSNRVIYDECEFTITGEMQPYIKFEKIERGLKGNEYTELYTTALQVIANASGVLSGLAGTSNGKMLGGSGSELRVAADYQQHYRTGRERSLMLRPLNQIVLPKLGLPAGTRFAFKSIQLQTLDENPTGSKRTVSTTE